MDPIERIINAGLKGAIGGFFLIVVFYLCKYLIDKIRNNAKQRTITSVADVKSKTLTPRPAGDTKNIPVNTVKNESNRLPLMAALLLTGFVGGYFLSENSNNASLPLADRKSFQVLSCEVCDFNNAIPKCQNRLPVSRLAVEKERFIISVFYENKYHDAPIEFNGSACKRSSPLDFSFVCAGYEDTLPYRHQFDGVKNYKFDKEFSGLTKELFGERTQWSCIVE